MRRHVGVREGTQGWTDAQMVTALVMLNLSGGESVDDLRVLEKDEGLGRVLLARESHEMRRAERTGQQYAEVCYVTDWTGYSKNSPDYRFIAIRKPLRYPRCRWEMAGGTK